MDMANLLKLGHDIAKRNPSFKPAGNFLSQEYAKLVFVYRMNAGLTQKQLAEAADVSPSTIHRIEGGSGGITDIKYAAVFNVLNITTADIANFFLERETSKERDLVEQL